MRSASPACSPRRHRASPSRGRSSAPSRRSKPIRWEPRSDATSGSCCCSPPPTGSRGSVRGFPSWAALSESSTVQEHLAGMSVVRAYTMEEHAARVFDAANGEYLGRSLRLARTMAAFVPLTGVITGVGALIVLWLGGREVIAGRLSLGALVAFNGYLAYLAWPTLALGWTLALLRRGLTSMARVQEIIDGAPAIEAVTAAESAGRPAKAPGISLQSLTFEYDDRV